jgi:hypothetical protein
MASKAAAVMAMRSEGSGQGAKKMRPRITVLFQAPIKAAQPAQEDFEREVAPTSLGSNAHCRFGIGRLA